uniref:Large ribosomal subunit protein mL39 n=1 Tax=Cacopsylla melanoneura TaxID=428564 RepID=A0A8D8RGI0_9HEMI
MKFNLCCKVLKSSLNRLSIRQLSSNIQKQNDLFNAEFKRQQNAVGRIEKINVVYKGVPEDAELIMNKNLSTPYNCAQHLSEMLCNRSVLALVDGVKLWDMHRPLESDCELQLLHFYDTDPYHCNRTFWRSCSIMLGSVLSRVFKEDVQVALHSFPSPNVKSGSFIYDVELSLPDWNPTPAELRVLSAEMVKLAYEELPFERLSIGQDLAEELFQHNRHKLEQIPSIVQQSLDGKVIVYRIKDHIDISRGPMMSNTNHLGRCTIASAHRIETDIGLLYRFQGVALPRAVKLNHFAYGIIEDRCKKLNPGRLPTIQGEYQPAMTSREEIAAPM